MLSWLHRSLVGVDAYPEARRSEREAKSRVEGKTWARVALAVAQKTSKNLGLGAAIQKAAEADVVRSREGAPSPPSISRPDPYRSDERVRAISAAAGPGQYRIRLVSGGTARSPEILKEVRIHASDVPQAIRQAFHIVWPPDAIGLILIDHEGREVFGRDNADRVQERRR